MVRICVVSNALPHPAITRPHPDILFLSNKWTTLVSSPSVPQDSLGGTAYTVVCCNVSPIEASESETLSTLRFAERLKKVISTDARVVVADLTLK